MKNIIAAFSAAILLVIAVSTVHAETLVLGTTKGSANYQTGLALSKALKASGIKLYPRSYSGTSIYAVKVDRGNIHFGISNPTSLNWAYNGIRTSKFKHENLRFVANLHFFKTGLAVRNESDIKSYDDLKGKRMPSGFRGAPGFHWNIKHKLLNANPPMTFDDVRPVPVTSLPGNWKAFSNGYVDASIIAIGSGHAKKLHAGIDGGIRMLSLNNGEAEQRLLDGWPGFEVITVQPHPKTPSIRAETRILTFPYMLWANKDVDPFIVESIVLALHENAEVYRKSSKMVSGFDESKMNAFSADVPLHEGAATAYEKLHMSRK